MTRTAVLVDVPPRRRLAGLVFTVLAAIVGAGNLMFIQVCTFFKSEYELSVAGLVLAAGGGRRYGGPKALVRRDDRLLVERAVDTVRDGGCAPIVVVLGAEAAAVRAQADLGDAILVDNPGWKSGMGSSLKVGLEAVGATAAEAVLVLLVDTPGITAGAVRRVADKHGPDMLVAATYEGRRGHPVLLGRDHWSGVASLATADIGARAYLMARAGSVVTVACEDIADDTDMDVPEVADPA